jgi:tRNA (cytidine/uridine-2'-O-)-methyltransferase
MRLHIVLVEPEIPQNTGNIARTCAALGATLHLVHPLGFKTDASAVRRAGLDYWHLVEIFHHDSVEPLVRRAGEAGFFASTRGGTPYASPPYPQETYLFFGKETRGLPQDLLDRAPGRVIRLPMVPGSRSLNLSNAVAVVAYEVARVHGFAGLS